MKLRVRDSLLVIVSVLALIAGCMSLFSNLGAEDASNGSERLMMWYLSLQTFLFIVIAVLAIVEVLLRDKLRLLKNALYGANVLIGGAYTLLVIVDASPLIAEFIAKELWRSAISIMTLIIFVIYIAIGLLVIALCVNKLRGHLQNQRSLGLILMVLAIVSTVPTVIFSFQYDISASLRTTTITYMLLSAVIQAIPVYAVFCREHENE